MEEDSQDGSLAKEPLTSEKCTVNDYYSSCSQSAANCHQLESAECSYIQVDVSSKKRKEKNSTQCKQTHGL